MGHKASFEFTFTVILGYPTLSNYACAAKRAEDGKYHFFLCILKLSALGRGTFEEWEWDLSAGT